MCLRWTTLSVGSQRRLGALALAVLAAVACNDDAAVNTLVGPDPTFAVIPQDADEFRVFGQASAPWGTATIRRDPTGVKVQLRVSDPAVHAALAGNAITLWVASFHNPEACRGGLGPPCTSSDLGNPDVGGALQSGGGRVLGHGPITLVTNVREGDDSGQISGTASGLVDARTDEIHVVIRSHGNPIPGKVGAQIGTAGGGCKTVNGNPGPDEDGNDCVDVAVAIFL